MAKKSVRRPACIKPQHPSRESRFKSFTDSIFMPFCAALARIGMTPNLISNLRTVLGLVGLVMLCAGFKWSGVSLFIIAIVMDSLDGGIARLRGSCSHRGTFIDKVADYTIYCASVVAMVYAEAVGGFVASYHVSVVFAAVILKIVADNEGEPSDWIINPAPRLVWFMIIWYAAFFVFVFAGKNYLGDILFWLNAALTLVALQSYIAIQSRWSVAHSKKRR